MALTDVFKNLGGGLGGEVREFRSILGRIRLTTDTSALGANFRKFGLSFGAYDFDAFVQKARDFYLKANETSDPLFTMVKLSGNRIAIDYNGEMRGIYTQKGKPVAFFRPDFRQSGYVSKSAELEDFRRGKVLFS